MSAEAASTQQAEHRRPWHWAREGWPSPILEYVLQRCDCPVGRDVIEVREILVEEGGLVLEERSGCSRWKAVAW